MKRLDVMVREGRPRPDGVLREDSRQAACELANPLFMTPHPSSTSHRARKKDLTECERGKHDPEGGLAGQTDYACRLGYRRLNGARLEVAKTAALAQAKRPHQHMLRNNFCKKYCAEQVSSVGGRLASLALSNTIPKPCSAMCMKELRSQGNEKAHGARQVDRCDVMIMRSGAARQGDADILHCRVCTSIKICLRSTHNRKRPGASIPLHVLVRVLRVH